MAINTLDYFRYTQTFAVGIATNYYNVLMLRDMLENQQENYQRLEDTYKFVQAQVDGGMVSRSAGRPGRTGRAHGPRGDRERPAGLQRALDQFKITLGLPVSTELELDSGELARLAPWHCRWTRPSPWKPPCASGRTC